MIQMTPKAITGKGPVERLLRPGCTVWTPPGERHWHGAAPDHFMTHVAMSGVVLRAVSQEAVTWQEHVSDADYASATKEI